MLIITTCIILYKSFIKKAIKNRVAEARFLVEEKRSETKNRQEQKSLRLARSPLPGRFQLKRAQLQTELEAGARRPSSKEGPVKRALVWFRSLFWVPSVFLIQLAKCGTHLGAPKKGPWKRKMSEVRLPLAISTRASIYNI